MNWFISSYTSQGNFHVQTNTPCQDKAHFLTSQDFFCLSLADGAGTSKFSEEGAFIATKNICSLMQRKINVYLEKNPNDLKEYIIERSIRSSIAKIAKKKQASLSDFSSTLLFLAANKEKFMFGHIGDGVIIGLKGDAFKVLSHSQNGEYMNSTVFTTSKKYKSNFLLGRGSIRDYKGFILLTDGISPLFYQKRGGVSPALHKLIAIIKETNFSSSAFSDILRKIIDDKRPFDDCGIIVALEQSSLQF